MKTYIINPDNNKPVPIEDWRKDENPTRAQLLAVETDDGHLLVLSKSYLPGLHKFDEAQKTAADFKPLEGVIFRCPTRKECIDLYDARFLGGLDEAVKLTGGDYGRKGKWFWTCERDADPAYASNAWYSNGTGGICSGVAMYDSNLALPVALLTTSEASLKP